MCFAVQQLSYQRDRLRWSKGRAELQFRLLPPNPILPALAVSLIGWSEGQLCEGGCFTAATAARLFCRGRLGPDWLVNQSRVVHIIDINKIRPRYARLHQRPVPMEMPLIALIILYYFHINTYVMWKLHMYLHYVIFATESLVVILQTAYSLHVNLSTTVLNGPLTWQSQYWQRHYNDVVKRIWYRY